MCYLDKDAGLNKVCLADEHGARTRIDLSVSRVR